MSVGRSFCNPSSKGLIQKHISARVAASFPPPNMMHRRLMMFTCPKPGHAAIAAAVTLAGTAIA